MLPSLAGVLLGAAALSAASSSQQPQTTVTLWIPSSQHLPNPQTLPSSTHATLAAHRALHDAPLTAAGAFVFRNVTPGSYLADVHCGTHGFAPLRVDVLPTSTSSTSGGAGVGARGKGKGVQEEGLAVRVWETYRGNEWDNKGQEVPRSGGEDGRFAVRALGVKEYYVERGGFSVLGILKNPMILMGLVSMALFIGVPKLVENMDPEMRAEFEEQQKNSPMSSLMGGGPAAGANPMGNFDMAAYLAGQSSKKDEGDAPSSSSGGKRGGKR